MSAIERARAFFVGVDEITIEQNTYRPELDGTRQRIDKVGASYFDAVSLDGRDAGRRFHGSIPTRVRDVMEITADTLTFRLGDIPRLAGHTVTYRKAPR